jgi:hypothetical protein
MGNNTAYMAGIVDGNGGSRCSDIFHDAPPGQ